MSRTPDSKRIYPRGTRLAAVPPDFRGVSWAEYVLLELHQQAEANYKATPAEAAPLSNKALWTPRDSYGWRS